MYSSLVLLLKQLHKVLYDFAIFKLRTFNLSSKYLNIMPHEHDKKLSHRYVFNATYVRQVMLEKHSDEKQQQNSTVTHAIHLNLRPTADSTTC